MNGGRDEEGKEGEGRKRERIRPANGRDNTFRWSGVGRRRIMAAAD